MLSVNESIKVSLEIKLEAREELKKQLTEASMWKYLHDVSLRRAKRKSYQELHQELRRVDGFHLYELKIWRKEATDLSLLAEIDELISIITK